MVIQEWERFKLRCKWSLEGWLYCWRYEHSLFQWIWANVASASLALVLDLTGAERALILALGILVLAAELMNTAIAAGVAWLAILVG